MGVKGNDKIAAPPVFVGESDLNLDDPHIKAIRDRLGLDYILANAWGFDTKASCSEDGKFYTVEVMKFRNRGGKVVEENRYSGVERLDDEWINEGLPSSEAKIAARQDMSYVRDVARLSQTMHSL